MVNEMRGSSSKGEGEGGWTERIKSSAEMAHARAMEQARKDIDFLSRLDENVFRDRKNRKSIEDRVVDRQAEMKSELINAKKSEWEEVVAGMLKKSDGVIPPQDFSISGLEMEKIYIRAVNSIKAEFEEEKKKFDSNQGRIDRDYRSPGQRNFS